jgi:hypothetical protein
LPGDGDSVVRLVEMLAEQDLDIPTAAGDVEILERLLGTSHGRAVEVGIGPGQVSDDAEPQFRPCRAATCLRRRARRACRAERYAEGLSSGKDPSPNNRSNP